MLEDIAEWCVDFALELRSPAESTVVPNVANSLSALYQQFTLLRGLIDSSRFRSALLRIQAFPHSQMASRDDRRSIARPFRARSSVVRSMVRSSRRVPLPTTHRLRSLMSTVSSHVVAAERFVTVDTAENRFVRFALETFDRFLRNVGGKAATFEDPSSRETRCRG